MHEAQVLRAAADLIEGRGWTQNVWENDDGEVCSMGAIRIVVVGQPSPNSMPTDAQTVALVAAYRALSWYVGDGTRLERSEIAGWNDDPSTTQELVTKTMRACADAIEDVRR